jgi:NADH-quinone oxidoreductase subunit M
MNDALGSLSTMNFPLLSLIILLPLLGAIATGVTSNIKLAKKIALAFSGL